MLLLYIAHEHFTVKKSCAKTNWNFTLLFNFTIKLLMFPFTYKYCKQISTTIVPKYRSDITLRLWFLLAISLITEVNIFMSWPNLYHLSDTNYSNLGVTHSLTQGYYSFSLRHFDPLPGHDPFRSLPPIIPSSSRCVPVFFVLSNLAPSCHISSSHLFLGFPADLLPTGLPSRIRFRIVIDYPYYMPSPM